MALQGSRFRVGCADPFGQDNLQVNGVGGLGEDLSKTLIRENNPVFLVSVNHLCLICLQLGKKGHSMSLTRKSSAECVYHVELAAVQGFCEYSLHNPQLPTSRRCQNSSLRNERQRVLNILIIDNHEISCVFSLLHKISSRGKKGKFRLSNNWCLGMFFFCKKNNVTWFEFSKTLVVLLNYTFETSWGMF